MRIPAFSYLWIILLIVAVSGCDFEKNKHTTNNFNNDAGTDADATDGELDADADGAVPDEVNWEACPSYLALDVRFKCAHVQLPLDHEVPDATGIGVFIYKRESVVTQNKKQVWFLQGGPGGTGAVFAEIFQIYAIAHPEWEMYSIEHRGVGNSERLTCSQEFAGGEFDYGGCAQELTDQWGDGLGLFNTTQAARDLAAVIDRTRENGVPVIVYGVSYGTYWALRYLRLYPEHSDGVILDSICAPGHCTLDEYDRNFDENGMMVMDACLSDATCGAKLSTIDADPWTAVGNVFAKVDAGTLCDGEYPFLDRPLLRQVLAMMEADFSLRPLIGALLYRLNRCDESDKGVLDYFISILSGAKRGNKIFDIQNSTSRLDASYTLGTNIITSELLGTLSLAEVQAIEDAAFFSSDGSVDMVRMSAEEIWPKYGDDGHMNRFGATSTPLLMLNGLLDPQTTLAMAVPARDYYTGANQTFVEVPYAPHGIAFVSFTDDAMAAYMQGSYEYLTMTCGFTMMEAFITDPTAAVDSSCLSALYPLEFSADSELNMALSSAYFGTSDMYEGSVQKSAAAPFTPPLNPVRTSPRGPSFDRAVAR
ncbi:alpha/beta hydrolase [Myxococcota bacterium]|nr:alpha/beta hydrolase [Myxococcota bacterium]